MKSRKISILLVVVALISGFSANAKVLGLGFGPKVGMNVNKFDVKGGMSNLLNTDNRCGFTVGATAEYIAPVIGLGFDVSLMYSYMTTSVGSNVHDFIDENGDYIAEGTTKDNVCGSFFEIPLHIKYKLSLPAMSSVFSPYVFTGPSVAFKLSGPNSYGNTKSTQWGWDLGLGFELFKHLQIGAGYTFGMNNLVKKTELVEGVSDDIKVKNNYWTVTAAWMF